MPLFRKRIIVSKYPCPELSRYLTLDAWLWPPPLGQSFHCSWHTRTSGRIRWLNLYVTLENLRKLIPMLRLISGECFGDTSYSHFWGYNSHSSECSSERDCTRSFEVLCPNAWNYPLTLLIRSEVEVFTQIINNYLAVSPKPLINEDGRHL